jgi:ribosomal protein S12 methylthiotransferase accessory factor
MRALEHALYEAVERHLLDVALPEGWTEAAILEGMVRAGALERRAPAVARWASRIAGQGLELFLFDLTPPGRSGWAPLAAALLFDGEGGPMPLTAGYACAPTWEDAALKAFLEAAQSRLTDIHGAREDVAPQDRGQAEALRQMCRVSAGASRRARGTASSRRRVSRQELLRRIFSDGFRSGAAVHLAGATDGAHVVKVVIPGLRVSGLL